MTAPLADRMRPKSIDDVVGQRHLFGINKPLRRLIEKGHIPNLIFYGPPGVGKTTAAKIISDKTNRTLRKLNCTTASTSDIREILSEVGTFSAPNGILLYLDEIQYFNKKQQQTLLEFIENGDITLIASTTENPYFYVYNAILSRSTVFEFKQVNKDDIMLAVKSGISFLEKELNTKIIIDDDCIKMIAASSSGDVRNSLNTLEICVMSSISSKSSDVEVTADMISSIIGNSALRYDRDSDEHYDTISAFQKSMRGSDPDAAIHYLARLIVAGDLVSICRRLLVCACEDVGLAYPQIIPIVKSCTDIAMQVGLPEARIPLADAVILVCNAPKSNSAYNAINEAIADIKKGNVGTIPRHLQNNHCDGEDNRNKGQFYKYPHDYPNHWVKQKYLPDEIVNKQYYKFGNNKTEQAFKSYSDNIKK